MIGSRIKLRFLILTLSLVILSACNQPSSDDTSSNNNSNNTPSPSPSPSPLPAPLPVPAPSPNPTSWTPPVGVPQVPFGITQQPGAANYFVNNTHPSATDTANPTGSPSKPRLTIPTSFSAGSIVEIAGGPYSVGKATWTFSGSSTNPVFIKGVGNPIIRGTEVNMTGSYFVVDGLIFEGIPVRVISGASYGAIRNCEIRYVQATSTAVLGTGIVLYNNHIHDNGSPNSTNETDWHGIKVVSPAVGVWIVDNHIHHNGGDSAQIGDAVSPEPWPRYVFIGRNHMHEDRENAVDIKQARDVIISSNTAYGYWTRASSGGEIMVIHNNPQRVWVINNRLLYSHNGVVCSGAQGYYVMNNLITHIFHDPNVPYNPNSLYGTQAIRTYNTTDSYHINNTIWFVDSGISYASGNVKTEIVNNIIGGLLQSTYQIGLPNTTATNASVISNNFFGGDVVYYMGGTKFYSHATFQSAYGKGGSSLSGDPLFVDTNAYDFNLQASSAARESGVSHAAYDAFQALYSIDIRLDLENRARPNGQFDMGAFEL